LHIEWYQRKVIMLRSMYAELIEWYTLLHGL
jgi:hypothetical protein